MIHDVYFEERVSETVVEFVAERKALFTAGDMCFGVMLLTASALLVFLSSKISAYFGLLVVVLCAWVVWYWQASVAIAESVIVIKDLGIQLATKYRTGYAKSKFIDLGHIESIFIHECIRGSSVRFQLAIIVQGDKRLTLSFKHVYPGFQNLQRVYLAALNCQHN